MADDYYKILGVEKKADTEEIKKAYRALARKYHPDLHPDKREEMEAKFKEINEAYEILSDKTSRKKYDKYGDKWQYADQFEQAAREQSQYRGFDPGGGAYHFSGDIGDMDSLFDDLFGGARGRTSSRQARPRRGQDLESHVEVTLEEALKHRTKSV